MSNISNESRKFKNKKRMMYIAGEDFYLYTYAVFNILHVLNCRSSESQFIDHRKLPFYIYIASNHSVADIYSRYKRRESEINQEDRKLLLDCYYNSLGKDKVIYRLITILEREGYLIVEKDSKSNSLNLYLSEDKRIDEFTSNELFKRERDNIGKVYGFYARGHTVKFETALNSLFYKFRVGNWLL